MSKKKLVACEGCEHFYDGTDFRITRTYLEVALGHRLAPYPAEEDRCTRKKEFDPRAGKMVGAGVPVRKANPNGKCRHLRAREEEKA